MNDEERGRRAQGILGDEVFQEVIARMETDSLQEFIDAESDEGRRTAQANYKAALILRAEFKKLAEVGQLAEESQAKPGRKNPLA